MLTDPESNLESALEAGLNLYPSRFAERGARRAHVRDWLIYLAP
jgi:hypothetical protein